MTGQKSGISLRVARPVRETMATFIPICDRDTENGERRIEEAAGIGFGCEGTGRPDTNCGSASVSRPPRTCHEPEPMSRGRLPQTSRDIVDFGEKGIDYVVTLTGRGPATGSARGRSPPMAQGID